MCLGLDMSLPYPSLRDGLANGMDLPQEDSASPPVPFQHVTSEKAKSFIALQELQNEVGALLEFRDVVMETFPQLRGKLLTRGRWEPGVRVRKKLREESSCSQPRSRSNSRSKNGSSGTSVVQDSGFCTESKKTTEHEAEDELWNLLDLIHTKGTKLRLEVESLQSKYRKVRRAKSLSDISGEPTEELHQQIEGLHREKEILLDRVSEMEAETLANLAQTNQLIAKINFLTSEKRDLEEQLKAATLSKVELNSRISDPQLHYTSRQQWSKNSPKSSHHQIDFTPLASRFRELNGTPCSAYNYSSEEDLRHLVTKQISDFDTPKNSDTVVTRTDEWSFLSKATNHTDPSRTKLGALDGIVSNPKLKIACAKGLTPDKEKTAAILKETNVTELQRHLITTSHENLAMEHKLQQLVKSRSNLTHQLEKYKEENDDLRFQLEEKSIELEGTRARVRLLERLRGSSKGSSTGTEGEPVEQCSSSTESAHNDESPARKTRPSRIPLKASKTTPSKLKIPKPSGTPCLNTSTPRTRGRKSSESSFNSSCSSPSIRTTPPPPPSIPVSSHLTPKFIKSPKAPPSSIVTQRIVAEPEPKVIGQPQKVEEPLFMDSLDEKGTISLLAHLELSRSSSPAKICSSIDCHCSLDYFDSINCIARRVQEELNSFNDDREALAELDSLNNLTSDLV